MKIEYFGSQPYTIKNIDRYEVEIDLLNCSEVAIGVNGFRVGNYDFLENKYNNSEWYVETGKDTFSLMTNRQQKMILKLANVFFKNLYKKMLVKDCNNQYYNKMLNTAKNNIKILGV